MKLKLITVAIFIAATIPAQAEQLNFQYWTSLPSNVADAADDSLTQEPKVWVNGRYIDESMVPSNLDLRISGANTGISVYKAGGTIADYGASWWDGAVEAVGRNGIIGANSEDGGIGVVGITARPYSTGVYGGVEVDHPDAIAVQGVNRHSGLAAYFEGRTKLDGELIQTLPNNGTVKAWAKVYANGNLHSCYNCTPATAVNHIATGCFWVTFNIGDISARPKTATLDPHAIGYVIGEISLSNALDQENTVVVYTTTSGGSFSDKPFTLVVY